MKVKKQAEINPNILNKVGEIKSEKIKEFLFEVLDLEYDKLEEARPNLKKDYLQLIDNYKE